MRRSKGMPALLAALALALGGAGCRSTAAGEAQQQDGGGAGAVEVSIGGARFLTPSELESVATDSLRDFRASPDRRWAVDDAAYLMEERYREAGFPDARVRYRIEREGSGTRVVFSIEEGPRAFLRDVHVAGSAAFAPQTVRAFFLGDDDERPYDASSVSSGLARLEERYLNAGYAEVELAEPEARFDESRTSVDLLIAVDEGPRYELTDVVVTGAEGLAVDLDAVAQQRVGEPGRLRLGGELRSSLVEALGAAGYLAAEVEMEQTWDAATGSLRLAFAVEAGPPYVVDEIEVRGADATRERTILRQLSFEPGDVFTTEDRRESFRRLYSLGIFRGVRLSAEFRDEERCVVVIEVQEDLNEEFFVEPGYGSYERARLTLGYRERNWMGRAIPLRAEVTVAQLAARGEVGVSQPNFLNLGPDVTGDLSVFGNQREEPSFTRTDYGVGASIGERFSDSLSGTIEYQYKRSKVNDIQIVDVGVLSALEDVDISSVTFALTRDTRDNVFLPHTGTSSRLALEVADESLGSEIDFVRIRGHQSLYWTLDAATVLAIGFRTGVIVPYGQTDEIPVQERFYNGGENSVRSYREDDLGTKDALGNAIGGESYNVLSVELRRRLAGNLGGALFVDTGSVSQEAADMFDFGTAQFGYALGVGVRYLLPIGPVRLDLGWNPDASSQEDDYVLHLSVGMAF